MVIHVKLKVKPLNNNIAKEYVILVSDGAHSPEPLLVVNGNTARELGFNAMLS